MRSTRRAGGRRSSTVLTTVGSAVMLAMGLVVVPAASSGHAQTTTAQPGTAPTTTSSDTGNNTGVTARLVDQTWFLPGNGSARLTVTLATTGIADPRRRAAPADRAADARVQIEIEARDPIGSRSEMDAFLASVEPTDAAATGVATEASDSTSESSSSGSTAGGSSDSVVDTVRVDLADTTFRKGRITTSVVVEPQDDDADQLAMPQQGIHPLVVRVLLDGEPAVEIPTFAERLPWGTTEPEPDGVTDLAVMGVVDSAPTLQPNGATRVDPAAIDELRRVRNVLERVGDVPITLAIRPELLDGLDRSKRVAQRTLVDDLAIAIGERPVMSEPYVGMDASSMVGAGLDDVYVDELRRGEDALSDAFPRAATVRSVAVATSPVTAEGADLLRDLGVRSVLLLGTASDAMTSTGDTGDTGDATDTVDASLGTAIALPTGGTVQAHVADPVITQALMNGATNPALMANHVIADLLLRQRELAALGASIDGHSFVLTSPTGALPSGAALDALAQLVDDDPRLEFATLDLALGRTDVRTVAGAPVEIATATSPALDLSDLAARLAGVRDDVATTGSMLPSGDERLQRWQDLMQIAPSDALSVEERNTYLDTAAGETAALRAAVIPPPETTFTLGGSSGNVSLSLRNESDVALTVVVRMSSPKLLFPEGPATVELAPGGTTIVQVPVKARSNNTFPVTVEVLTPWQLRPVTAPVQLTARVTAYTGLGQVVTGAAVLILLTWWARHWRANRRRRLAASGAVSSG